MKKLSSRQAEIIELTKQLFSELGYQETSMRLIAQRLDIKAASLYSHFESKDHILKIICDEFHDSLENIMVKMKEVEKTEDGLFLFIHLYISAVISMGSGFSLYHKYYMNIDEKFGNKYSEMNTRFYDFIRNMFEEAFPNFVEKPFYKKDTTILFFIGTLNNIQRYINFENPDTDRIAKDLYERWLYGFKKDMNPNYVNNFKVK